MGDGMPLANIPISRSAPAVEWELSADRFVCAACAGTDTPLARTLGVFGLLVSLNIDFVRLAVALFAEEPFDGDDESKGWIDSGCSIATPALDWNDTRLLIGGRSETREVLPLFCWVIELQLEGNADVVGEGNNDTLDDDAAGEDECARDTCDGLRKVITVLAEPGMGGNAASSKFARDGTRGIEGLTTTDIGSIAALLGGPPALIDG